MVVLYEHEHGGVTDELTEPQHEFTETIIAVHHVHISDRLCLESIADDGPGERIEALLSRIRPLNASIRSSSSSSRRIGSDGRDSRRESQFRTSCPLGPTLISS